MYVLVGYLVVLGIVYLVYKFNEKVVKKIKYHWNDFSLTIPKGQYSKLELNMWVLIQRLFMKKKWKIWGILLFIEELRSLLFPQSQKRNYYSRKCNT
jgi:hypothetical protein